MLLNTVTKLFIRAIYSLLLAVTIFSAIAEVIYFCFAISSPTPNGYLLPIDAIPVFYYMYYSVFSSNWVLSTVSLALWFIGVTAYLFLRLSVMSRGAGYKYVKREFVLLVGVLFAVVNLALGMFVAAFLILMFMPVFVYFPLPHIKSKKDITAGRI